MSTIERQISYLVHDVEPALASFQSILRLLKRGRFDSQNELHQNLVSSCELALSFSKDMMQTILQTSKLQKGEMPVHPEWVFWDQFGESLVLPQLLAQEEEIHFEWKPLQAHLKTETDPQLVRRILNNLCLNAIKNVNAGTLIQVTVEQKGNSTLLHVLDEGPGVPEEKLSQIFEAHVQLELRDSKIYNGVGLGLSFCREASDLLGAKIFAQNRHPHGLDVCLQIHSV